MGQAKRINRLYRYVARRAATRQDAERAIGTIQRLFAHSFVGHWPLHSRWRCDAFFAAATIEAISKPATIFGAELVQFVTTDEAANLDRETDFAIAVCYRLMMLIEETGLTRREVNDLQHIVRQAFGAQFNDRLPSPHLAIHRTLWWLVNLCVTAVHCGYSDVAGDAECALMLMTDCVPLSMPRVGTWQVLAG